MKILDKFAKLLSPSSGKSFEELPSWALVILGAPTFLIASYFAVMFAGVVPDFVDKVNELGFDRAAVKIFLLLFAYSVPAWLAGCVAARCHTLLYDRWFK